jgi:SPP1 gp7 family putative phage head morphogenesis protein
MTAANDLRDQTVSHQIGLLRLSNATVAKMLALLARTEADIVRQLRLVDPDSVIGRRLDAQIATVSRMYREAYDELTGTLVSDLADLAEYEAQYTARQLTRAVGTSFNVPTRSVVVAAANSRPFQGRFLREWMAGIGEDQGRRVRDAVRIGFVEGESLAQIVARVRGTRVAGFKDGILEIGRRSTERIVRTAITHTATRAREAAFASNGDLVRGVQWTSVLDGRTSLVCAARDGKEYPINEGPRPPAHPNCRSQITAVLDGLPPPDRTTYEEWLRRQSTEFQNEVLGPARARAWRSGEVPLGGFVDRKGQAWSLDELRRREGLDI